MKTSLQQNLLLIYVLILFLLFLSCTYFYPVTRDQFYYLTSGHSNVFSEYYNSYLQVNARIGQFFSNLSGRNMFFNIITSSFTFTGLFYMVYTIVLKKLPKSDSSSVKKLIIILGLFIFLINYFGEMFFYIPFSTNYTLTNIFYLVYIFIITGYFIYGQDYLSTYKIPVWAILLLGLFTGLGNEHVPPALIFLTGLLFLRDNFKNKKISFPSLKVILYAVSVGIGYLILFVAPANKARYAKEGQAQMSFSLPDYLEKLKKIGITYYHYNFELSLCLGLSVIILAILYFKKKTDQKAILEIVLYLFTAVTAIFITAYSPIIGTRLLFFSNVLFIIVILIVLFKAVNGFKDSVKLNSFFTVSGLYVLFYFAAASAICYHGNQNYRSVMDEIKSKSLHTEHVTVKQSFDYQAPFFKSFNRKVILDHGNNYIDTDEKVNTPMERNIINFFRIKTLKSEK